MSEAVEFALLDGDMECACGRPFSEHHSAGGLWIRRHPRTSKIQCPIFYARADIQRAREQVALARQAAEIVANTPKKRKKPPPKVTTPLLDP